MLDRLVLQRITASKQSCLLLGPRQVGKSTIARSLKPDLFINLADEEAFLRHSKDAGLLKRELQAIDGAKLIVIDEIQRVPSLLNTVQLFIDDPDIKHRFILTGSSARKLRRGSVNLLPGRVIQEYLDPLSVLELGEQFNLERALQLGMLPGIYLEPDAAVPLLGTYAETYLREEIQVEALTRDIGSYARFLDVMAVVSGSWLNYSKISSDTEIPKETIRRYVSILEDTLIAVKIPPFRPREKITRRVNQRDKIFLFDIGVRNALLGLHTVVPSPHQIGSVFEHWLILQIVYLNRALRKNWLLTSYRSAGGAEVDIVIETASQILGIEIKYGTNVSPSQTRGLLSLEELIGEYKPYKKWIAYRGESSQRFDNNVIAHPYIALLSELSQLD